MKKILVVDDEKDFVSSVKDFLEVRGYAVITAYDGIEALRKIKESPDMVLLDIKMPGMDGFEILRRIRSNLDALNTIIIMLTSKTEADSIFESQHSLANDYIIKPANMEELLALIKRYLDDNKRRPMVV